MSVRTRVIGAVVAAGSVAVGGLLLERWVGPRSFAPLAAEQEVSGAWFCPHGGGDGWRGWIAIGNPSETDAEILVTTYSEEVSPAVTRTSVPPGSERFVEVPAARMASGSVVEFFGAGTSAGWVVTRSEGGLGAEPCSARAGKQWYVAEGTSERGQQSWLVVLNPYSVDAIFDVALTGAEPVAQAGELRGVVLPARQAAALNLNRFALGMKTLAATVRVSLGKVAVAGFGLGESGVRSVLAAAVPARRWFLPGAADDGPSSLAVLAPEAEVPLGARIQGPDAQVDAALGDTAVPAGRADTFEVLALQSGLAVNTKGPAAFVAGRRLSLSTAGDQGATGGTTRTARHWIAPPALGPEGGQSFLIVQNVGAEAISAGVSLLTPEGRTEPPELAAIAVEPGLTLVLDLSEASGSRGVTAVVEADRGTLVVAQASVSSAGYAVAVGVRPDQVRPI